jgi:hypothetical protein
MRNSSDSWFLLLMGIVPLFIGVASLLTGETFWGRLNPGLVDRAEEPIKFWMTVAPCLIVGFIFIGLDIAEISN